MSVVNQETVKYVARLARLKLEGQTLQQIAAQLDQILVHVQQLQAVPTDSVEPTSHVLELSNVLRKDDPAPSLTQEVVLALAPAKRPPFVSVPKVIDAA